MSSNTDAVVILLETIQKRAHIKWVPQKNKASLMAPSDEAHDMSAGKIWMMQQKQRESSSITQPISFSLKKCTAHYP